MCVFCLSMMRMCAIMSDNGQLKVKLSCEMRCQEGESIKSVRILIYREEASGEDTAYNL